MTRLFVPVCVTLLQFLTLSFQQSTPVPLQPVNSGQTSNGAHNEVQIPPPDVGNNSQTSAGLCNTTAALGSSCPGLPQDIIDYFHGHDSVDDILNTIYRPDIMNDLKTQCSPGSWCLPESYQQEIIKEMNGFYAGPACGQTTWNCLSSMLQARGNCNDQKLFFLCGTISLLCDLQAIGQLRSSCSSRIMETLMVTYADIENPTVTEADASNSSCIPLIVQFTQTYHCAKVACDRDEDLFLHNFGPWTNIDRNANTTFNKCNVTKRCQRNNTKATSNDDADIDDETAQILQQIYEIEAAAEAEVIDEEIQEEETEMENMSGFSSTSTTPPVDEGLDKNTNMEKGSGEDQTMLFAIISVATVLVLAVAFAGIMGIKKFRKNKAESYKKGYSQLSDEESRMLKSDYTYTKNDIE